MHTSEKIENISAALVEAQKEFLVAPKGKDNPFFRSKYADLATIAESCLPALWKHGIAVLQPVSGDGMEVSVTTRLIHSSGEWMEETANCRPVRVVNKLYEKLDKQYQMDDPTPQAVGSAITYMRRYTLAAMLCLVTDDDDGNAASGLADRVASQQSVEPPKKKASTTSPAFQGDAQTPLPTKDKEEDIPDDPKANGYVQWKNLGEGMISHNQHNLIIKIMQSHCLRTAGKLAAIKALSDGVSSDEATKLIKGMKTSIKTIENARAQVIKAIAPTEMMSEKDQLDIDTWLVSLDKTDIARINQDGAKQEDLLALNKYISNEE